MTAIKGFEFDGAEKARKKAAGAKTPPPPAKTKVPASPTEAFKTVAIPMPIRSPDEFKPQFLPEGEITPRKHVRVKIHDEVVVAYKFLERREGTPLSQVLKGRLVDLSEGGLQLDGIRPAEISILKLTAGDVLIGMNLFLPYVDGRLKVLGQVTWEKASNVPGRVLLGIRFLDMDDQAKAGLKAYFIASQMPARRKRSPTPDR